MNATLQNIIAIRGGTGLVNEKKKISLEITKMIKQI